MEKKITCVLCGREIGKAVEMHHLIPKSEGGRVTVPLHPICHRKVHALFNEKELAKHYATIEALRSVEEIRRFVAWLRGKPPDFYRRTEPKGGRGRKR
ncbi:HNH endonuclease [Kordiimonas sp.]|uniref:HNH endonuclease n=1 Tax=Kordiimonas sp. TaxID=1970157 RepID=UPI003A8F3A07